MTNAYIIHGRNSNPKKAWIPWLRDELVKLDYKVFTPKMPNALFPSQDKWHNSLDKIVKYDEKSIFIGHSLGCQTILRYIASRDISVEGIFLISPFQKINTQEVYNKTKEKLPEWLGIIRNSIAQYSVNNANNWCNKDLPWKSLIKYEEKTHLFFSTNDYYIGEDQQKLFHEKLPNAKITIIPDGGHLGDGKKLFQFDELIYAIRDNKKSE